MTKNKRAMLIGKCVVCGKNKSIFIKQGHGVINDILNSKKLPELHIPGYNYCGPGTKLRERLLRDDKPVNSLDEACQMHDMHYGLFKDTKDRHVFDKKLQSAAFRVAKNANATLKEKLDAGLVGTAMLTKRKLGLGQK